MDESSGASEVAALGVQQRPSRDGLVVGDSYRIGQWLGGGGMGDVYEAEHVRLESPLAVKFLRDSERESPQGIQRFRREARRVASVRSEHIVKVFDYRELDDGTPYLVMERLFGEDLRALLAREGPLPIRRAVQLAIETCRGLSVVHAAGLVHRDLKPANLFVEKTHGGERCKILDFGVVKALTSESTRSGGMLGTVRYMAPEQIENASTATQSADIYSVGAILYECLTGHAVHSESSLQQTLFAILQRDPRPPSEFRELPAGLEPIVLRALSRDVASRFADADALARALAPFGAAAPYSPKTAAFDDVTVSEKAGPDPVTARAQESSPRVGAGWLVVAALGIGGTAGAFLRGGEAPARAGTPSRSMPVVPSSSLRPTALAPASVAPAPPPARSAATPSAAAPPTAPRSFVPKPRARVENAAKSEGRNVSVATTNQGPGEFDPRNPYE